ncbi:MAG: glutathione peroxidase [Deltaproteobacteria bacterium]|nr:MAG: glutathione peroxidase [Deltaproteobacteria bacterium]
MLYDIDIETLTGEAIKMGAYRGKVLLIVNTASRCGLTPQFEELEELHQDYGDRGFTVLGFPCNQFANQEPGTSDEIGAFCQRNYGVSFPMHAKVDVNGRGAHPLYQHLRAEKSTMFGSAIKWNFTKFLVDAEGRVVERFGSKTLPKSLRGAIEKLLPH